MIAIASCNREAPSSPPPLYFEHDIIDSSGPGNSWGKAAGDLNGDGLVDLIVGGRGEKKTSIFQRILIKIGLLDIDSFKNNIVWYENPTWQAHVISRTIETRTDIETGDIDGDGKIDIVLLADQGIVWLRNPDWHLTLIDTPRLHDLKLSDFDGDGDLDLAARGQSAFGSDDSDHILLYRQDNPDNWTRLTIDTPSGEGLAAIDADLDGDHDLVVNNQWFENPGQLTSEIIWKPRIYSTSWDWPHVKIAAADINGDGRPDLVLTPAELAGQYYHLSWFEGPSNLDNDWTEHIIENNVETVLHSLAVKDANGDGQPDILTAEMQQSEDPDEVNVYYNIAMGEDWQKHTIGTQGSHNIVAVDIDRDSDIDIFGTNWNSTTPRYDAVDIWRNNYPVKQQWRRHVIDGDRPGRALFIFSEDLDGDHKNDIVTGAYWYKNPGDIRSKWKRSSIGEGAGNAALVADFDQDGDSDILASSWLQFPENPSILDRIFAKFRGAKESAEPAGHTFVWARNNGNGDFSIYKNIEKAQGDFLQGATLANSTKEYQIFLSWHQPDYGIQSLSVPTNADKGVWRWQQISSFSQDEQINAADIDGDGDQDLVSGTSWLRYDGDNNWHVLPIHLTENLPDRNSVADINKDGKLDVIVGYQAISKPGSIAWYEQGSDPGQLWKEHIIGTAIGPMSLDVGDIDHDKDLDIIIGEHNLKSPETAQLIMFENIDGTGTAWNKKIIYTGDEHHDGARLVDIDNDGDLDILSIGWGHNRALLYENLEFDL